MKLKITEDENFLVIVDSTLNELEQVEYSLTRRPDNWFILKKKIPHWNGEIRFLDNFNRIPLGLWKEVQNIAEKYNFPLEIEGADILIDKTFEYDDFDSWLIDHFKDSEITPRDYQIEAAKRIIKFRKCTEEISTSGGKTLISYMIFKYLLDKKKINTMLYIVPNVGLVNQTEEKFYEYEDKCGFKPQWKSDCVFGGKTETDKKFNIVFGTYQTLTKRSIEYFAGFDAINVDECHHSSNSSTKGILVKCYNAKYKYGLTGTLPHNGSTSSFIIQSYLGPCVYTVHSSDLIDSGNATPVNVIGLELDYLDESLKKKFYDLRSVKGDEKDGSKLLNLEKDTARNDRKRFNYICETISKSTKNSLVLFGDIKNEYGRNIYNWLRENTDKTVYYIDGGTNVENRDYYKQKIEEDENVILIASVGTFSEGIDILNVHNIYIVESNKSQFIVRQILGRGMRLMNGKPKIIVIDFSDNYEWGTGFQKKNYLIRHSDEREKIYKEKKFPFKRFKIKL